MKKFIIAIFWITLQIYATSRNCYEEESIGYSEVSNGICALCVFTVSPQKDTVSGKPFYLCTTENVGLGNMSDTFYLRSDSSKSPFDETHKSYQVSETKKYLSYLYRIDFSNRYETATNLCSVVDDSNYVYWMVLYPTRNERERISVPTVIQRAQMFFKKLSIDYDPKSEMIKLQKELDLLEKNQ